MSEKSIGRYEVKGELGRGGMATVFHGYDPSFGRDVAIKVLPKEMMHDPQFKERFEREGRTIAALEHPAIVPVYDVGEEDGTPFLVMRYMTGGTLSARLKEGPLTTQEASTIIARLASALDEAHKHGIIHRDLKPGNILFDRFGEAYLSDFGIVKITGSSGALTGSGIIGTPFYMSPEQAYGNRELDGRSDVYSLGVILFEMLTGRLPYEGDTPMNVAMKHIMDPVPDIMSIKPDLSSGVNAIITRALAKDPAARYQTAGGFSADLVSVAGGGGPAEAALAAGDAGTAVMAGGPATAQAVQTKPLTAPAPDDAGTVAVMPPGADAATRAPVEAGEEGRRALPLPLVIGAALLALLLVGAIVGGILLATGVIGPVGDDYVDTTLFWYGMDEVETLKVDISLGASTFSLEGDLDESSESVWADFVADEEVAPPLVTYNPQARVGNLSIQQEIPPLFIVGEDPMGDLAMYLTPGVDLDLTFRSGIGEAVLDLTDISVESVNIQAGSTSDLTVFLPASSDLDIAVVGTLQPITFVAPEDPTDLIIRSFRIEPALGELKVELPLASRSYQVDIVTTFSATYILSPADGLEVQVVTNSDLITVVNDADLFQQIDDTTWQTEGFEQVSNRAVVIIEGSGGTVQLSD